MSKQSQDPIEEGCSEECPVTETRTSISRKPKEKRTCTTEQLERLKAMREKALEARRAKAAARQEEVKARVAAKEEAKIEAAVQKAKSSRRMKRDDSSDSDGGSPPVAAASRELPTSVEEKKTKKKRKPVKVALEASSSDSETEIVIRKSRRGRTKAKPDLPPLDIPEPKQPVQQQETFTKAEVEAMMDKRLASFKQSSQDDEMLRLIRNMLPNYGR